MIHTVLSEPDESRLSLVWRGSAVALRPYICWMTCNACPLELSGEIFRPERIYESILWPVKGALIVIPGQCLKLFFERIM